MSPAKIQKRKTYKRKVSAKPRKVSKSVKTYVKKVLASNAENKYAMNPFSSNVAITAASGTLPTFWDLTPLLTQGTSVSTRIGNKVRVRAAYLNWRCVFPMTGLDATDIPMNVYFMIARPRQSQNTVTTTETDQLFFSGNSLTSNFDSGDAQSSWFIPNKEFWDIRYWTRRPLKLAPSGNSASPPSANNDFKLEYQGVVNMKKIYNKILRFNNTSSTAQGSSWYCIWFVQKIDLTISTVGWNPPFVTGQVNLLYEDD